MARLLKASDVAKLFGVEKQTVTRWALQRKISAMRTPGGHYRFDADYIARLIEQANQPCSADFTDYAEPQSDV